MKVAIMQPYLFPYIGYWQLINAVNTFMIYDDVTFIKQGFINRNYILIAGEKKRFTLELLGASSNKYINEIKVGGNTLKLLKTIEMAYKKAPQFESVFPIIQDILSNNERNLAKFIGYSLKKISAYLEIDAKFIYSSEIEKNDRIKAQEKILDICKTLGAKCYINAIGGKELYSKDRFKEEGINLHFLKTEIQEYKQFKNEFIPYLSIIDIMMFNSKREIREMLERYELI